MFYVSTCRKPVQQTRTLAKWLARLFGGYYENRGKRNLDELLSRASGKGLSRILFIYERHGNPSEISFYDEEQGWLSPEMRVKHVEFPSEGAEKKRVPSRCAVVFKGADAEKARNLFSHAVEFGEEAEEHCVNALLEQDKLSFSYKGVQVGPVISLELHEVEKKNEGEAK